MIPNTRYALFAVPLALAISACGSPEATQETQDAQAETATLEQPGFDGQPATPSQAQSEAATLAQHLSSGDLSVSEAETALNDLDALVNDNIGDFPQDIRESLRGDIESARSALEADYMGGVEEAAAQIESKLSDTASASDAG